ncbi:MAG: tetratricopeptide repeat protein [Planctomycetota bacterium]
MTSAADTDSEGTAGQNVLPDVSRRRRGGPWLVVITVAIIAAGSVLVAGWMTRDEPLSSQETFERGLIALDAKDYRTFRSLVAELQRHDDSKELAKVLRAAFHIRTNSPNEAVQQLLSLDLNGPFRPQILLFLGEAFYKGGQLANARNTLSMLVEEVPDSVDAHRWLASTWYDLGANVPAIYHLTEVTRLAPDDYRPHWLMGVMYRDFENYTASIHHLKEAWTRDPQGDVRNDIAVILSRSFQAVHQYDESLGYLKQCDETPEIMVEKAKANFNLTNHSEAERLLRTSDVPKDEQAAIDYYLLFGDLLETKGELQEAASKYEAGVRQFPFDEDLHYRFALVLGAMGDSERAATEMAEWKRKDKLKSRLVELNEIASKEPDNADVRFQLAEVCRQMKRTHLAEMWLNAAKACVGSGRPDPKDQNVLTPSTDADAP